MCCVNRMSLLLVLTLAPLRFHLVGQIQHAQVGLYFEAEGREAGHTVLWPGELVQDDGILRVQLLLLPAQTENTTKAAANHGFTLAQTDCCCVGKITNTTRKLEQQHSC